MTYEGRLRRGKENYEAGKWLDNPETLEYLETLASNDTDYSAMTMKQLKEAMAKEGLEMPEKPTKDDLIVLLENKSDIKKAEVVQNE